MSKQTSSKKTQIPEIYWSFLKYYVAWVRNRSPTTFFTQIKSPTKSSKKIVFFFRRAQDIYRLTCLILKTKQLKGENVCCLQHQFQRKVVDKKQRLGKVNFHKKQYKDREKDWHRQLKHVQYSAQLKKKKTNIESSCKNIYVQSKQ